MLLRDWPVLLDAAVGQGKPVGEFLQWDLTLVTGGNETHIYVLMPRAGMKFHGRDEVPALPGGSVCIFSRSPAPAP